MDITQFVEALRRDLSQAAEAGTDEVRAAAERLALALDPAVRLTLMDTLSQAASEITKEMFDSEDETVARITLRLPESLKTKAEDLAARRGQSLNTWLVNAARMASAANIDINIMGSMGPGAPGRNRSSNKRIQGWVR